MTNFDFLIPEDPRLDQLRHCPTLLKRWHGGTAKLWQLTSNHPTLTIRVQRSGVHGNLHVLCIEPFRIRGPGDWWENSSIEIVLSEGEGFVVRDERAGLEILTASVEIKENCSPLHTPL